MSTQRFVKLDNRYVNSIHIKSITEFSQEKNGEKQKCINVLIANTEGGGGYLWDKNTTFCDAEISTDLANFVKAIKNPHT